MTRLVIRIGLLWGLLSAVCTPVLASVTTTSAGNDVTAMVCLANPGRTQTWLREGVDLARRLGLGLVGTKALLENVRTVVKTDPMSPELWSAIGMDPSSPLCLAGMPEGETLAFRLVSEKAMKEALPKLLSLVGVVPAGGFKMLKEKMGPATLYRFVSARDRSTPPHFFVAVVDDIAFLAGKREALQFLARQTIVDHGARLALGDGDVVITGFADVAALGKVRQDADMNEMAEAAIRHLEGSLVIAQREARVRLKALNGSALALVGAEMDRMQSSPGHRTGAIGYLGEQASGFVQLNLPAKALADWVNGAFETLPERKADLGAAIAALSGDVTFLYEDGLASLALVASVADVEALDRGIRAAIRAAGEKDFEADTVTIAHREVRRLRFGARDDAWRFTLLTAVHDRRCIVTLTQARMHELLTRTPGSYLDQVPTRDVREAIESGAALVSHVRGMDLFSSFLPLFAVIREGLSRDAMRYADLLEYPVLLCDLLRDSAAWLKVSEKESELSIRSRFFAADPTSSDSREAGLGRVLAARYAPSTITARNLLLDLVHHDASDAVGQHARRVLVQGGGLADLFALAAGALLTQLRPPFEIR